ncbi:MAG: hypothetical protein ACTSO2_19700 [Promethearchaeota archaeon]
MNYSIFAIFEQLNYTIDIQDCNINLVVGLIEWLYWFSSIFGYQNM